MSFSTLSRGDFDLLSDCLGVLIEAALETHRRARLAKDSLEEG